MILDVLKDQPIKIDGVPKMYNLRLNLVEGNQFRLKMIYISESGEVPMDIVVFQYSNPQLVKTSLAIDFDGKDMIKNLKFHGDLSFDFFKRRWKLKGKLGGKKFNESFYHVAEVIPAIGELYASMN